MNEFETKMIDGMATVKANQQNTNDNLDKLHTRFDGLDETIKETATQVAVNTKSIEKLENSKEGMWKRINENPKSKKMVITAGAALAGLGAILTALYNMLKHHLPGS